MAERNPPTQNERLRRQLEFLLEADQLKHVLRQSLLIDPEKRRRENSAEHSWHISLLVMVLLEYANDRIDPLRVLKMLLLHDLVEIDAGDTYIYDVQERIEQEEAERKAARRIFGLLPEDQAAEFLELWEEYEARQTPDAKFAYAMDRLMPTLHNFYSQGQSWKDHGTTKDQVIARNKSIEEGAEALWEFERGLIEEAVRRGYLAE